MESRSENKKDVLVDSLNKTIHALKISQGQLEARIQSLEHKCGKQETALQESAARETQACARAQEKSETIDRLIHIIGNAINSVTIGLGTIQTSMSNRTLTRYLRSLADAVEAHQNAFGDYVENDPQGQKVAQFIVALAKDFAQHDEELAMTATRVHERAEHIANVIRETQEC